MDDHTVRVLEFEKVLTLVAAEAAFSVGRERVLAIRPATEFAEAHARQTQTAEMRLVDQMGIDIPFAGARDIRPHIRSAAIGQALDPPDLVDASGTLRAAWRAKQVIDRFRARTPSLGVIADGVCDFRRFVDAVDEAITARGEVADAASEELASVRRSLRIAQDRLDRSAQSALADAIRRGIVQDALLTERNGRKVIPIKADHKGAIAGIVHDVSSSGATVFIEPMGVVDAGNAVRELQLAEDREVRRVLQRLTALLGDREHEAAATVDALAHLDALTAMSRFAKRTRSELPPPGEVDTWLKPSGATVVVRGRHPLLRGDVVPTDMAVGGEYAGVLITGPNTGGKTVALKTIGLLTLMAQAGLPVPCDEGSRIVVYERIYADIGDEQSIEQSLSTFSSHMRNVKSILELAAPGTLVLLDELGAGTDPTEGSALARAILEELLGRGCTLIATTHHGELKAFAHNDRRLRNASVEFNVETLSPTYHLTVGLPGQSNAIAIARRLGIEEAVLERAQEQLSPEHFEMETLLEEIRGERHAAAEARRREDLAHTESELLRRALAERRERIEEERTSILDAARREAEDEVAAVRREVEALRRKGVERRDASLQGADETLRALDARLATMKQRARPVRDIQPVAETIRDLRPGDRIHVRDIPQEGEALSGIGEDGRVDVQFGSIRMKVSVDRIDRAEPKSGPDRIKVSAVRPNVAIEIDLRGQRAEEALGNVEGYLDDAFRAGLPFVRLIHGKGTGALRAALRERLRGHPLIRRLEAAPPEQGGEGVTVAILAG